MTEYEKLMLQIGAVQLLSLIPSNDRLCLPKATLEKADDLMQRVHEAPRAASSQ